MSTVFSKIIQRDVPAYIVYEDDRFIAFLDIIQATPGHTLVVVKQEFSGISEIPDELSGDFFKVVKKVVQAVKSSFNVSGVNILCNDGIGAGQTVFHFHMHIIPRYDHDDIVIKLKNHMHETQKEDYQIRADLLTKALMK